jgi:hypothetical protein
VRPRVQTPSDAAAFAAAQVAAVRDDRYPERNALVAAPRLALGRLRPFSRPLGDPRLGTAGIFLSLRRTVPAAYPLPDPLEQYLRAEATIGRTLDYVVIRPRLQRLYEWSAVVLGAPGLRGLIDDGAPVYAWPLSERELFDRPLRPGRPWARA